MSADRADRPASTARRGSLPSEPEPVFEPAHAGAPLTSSVFGDGEGDDTNSLQGRMSRLDNIFAMLSILDGNDDVMLRRLESELMRLEANDLQRETSELARQFDERIEVPADPTASAERAATSQGFYDLLYSLSELEAQAQPDRLEDAAEPDQAHLNGQPESLLLPNGTPLTSAHIDIVSHALANARQVLGLEEDSDREPVDRIQEQGRRLSSVSEPDREQREGEGEQIEGYEGDRAEPSESHHGSEHENSELAGDRRVPQIIETLRAFHRNGTGAEELDDFVLQAVLQLHAGPSTNNANSSPDHLGIEQMQLYQNCIAAIDDFFEMLTMMNDEDEDHTDHEHRGGISADDDAIEDDDNYDDESEVFRSRTFSRRSS